MIWFQIVRCRRTFPTSQPVFDHFLRSGMVFFLSALGIILFVIVGGQYPAARSVARYSNLIIAILSINCSRLILDIRQQFYAHRSQYQSTTKHKTAGISIPIELTRLDNISADEITIHGIDDNCQNEILDRGSPATLSTVVEED